MNIHKYCIFFQGDGPKLVRELFRVAEEHAPSIVFIDEIDAVGTKRYDSNSGGEREIQRTMLELLNQLDGFDSRGDVKVFHHHSVQRDLILSSTYYLNCLSLIHI